MPRPMTWKVVWTLSFVLCAVLRATAQTGTPTCDARSLDADSYALTTRGMAEVVLEERTSWWDSFIIGTHAEALGDLNFSATSAAEHALRLDGRNLLAHSILARQYVIAGEDADYADQAWRTVLDNGGAIVWTATLYDVDAKSYFVVAIDRSALRIYRFGELAGPFEKKMGVPRMVGADRERFWRAWGGCVDSSARPEAVIPWSDVREIKGGNWVLWFKLNRQVAIVSDNGKRKTVDEIKVNLHGATGSVDIYVTHDYRDPANPLVRGSGMGPFGYNHGRSA